MTQAKRPPMRVPSRVVPSPEAPGAKGATEVQGGTAEAKREANLSRFSFIDNRYALEILLGRGGMGEVWSAYDRKLGRRVALKLVPFEGASIDDAPARLAREHALASLLRGPAFAEVFGYGVHHGSEPKRAYLVMELLDGETLQARLERQGRLTLAEARETLAGIAVALRAAHARRIIHRDLKPANVFFARSKGASSGVRALDGRKEIVKLLDFGIARETTSNERLTRPGMLVGSSQYMSPEQIGAHKEVDTRTDLWSLGVLLFRAITGQRPFKGANGEVFARILQDAPPRVTSFDRTLPRGLDAFFRRALEKHPTMRFQTIDELVEGFEDALKTTTRTPSGPLELDITWDDGARPSSDPAERPTRAEMRVSRASAHEPDRLSLSIDVDLSPSIRPAPELAPDPPTPARASTHAPAARFARGSMPSLAARRTIRMLSIAVVVLVAIVVVLAALFFYRRP